MKTISFMAQKGGCGKTTLAVNLAVAAVRADRQSGLIDLDQQGSSYRWWRERKNRLGTTTPGVFSSQAVALPDIIEAADETDFVFIDTAPQITSDTELIMQNSDIILLPVKTSLADFATIETMYQIAIRLEKKIYLVLSMVPTSGTLFEEALQYLESKKYNLSPVYIYNRADYIRSYTSGQGAQEYKKNSAASKEISNLYNWLLTIL
jgi:chromosome partitioning protein